MTPNDMQTNLKKSDVQILKDVIVVIPAYNPEGIILTVIQDLQKNGFQKIVVVDDGSSDMYVNTFRKINELHTSVVRHRINQGKGAAIKKGIAYCCERYPQNKGVVIVDADGQHVAKDVVRVAWRLHEEPHSLVIGTRSFDATTPFLRRFGNVCTKHIFKVVVGEKISDTQSGLRGIPYDFLPHVLEISENGYEFELEMLIQAKKTGVPMSEEPISTVYINGTKNSHFKPIRDSFKIYFVLLRYVFNSIVTALVDYMVFISALTISDNIIVSQFLAIFIAMGANFIISKKIVFKNKANISKTILLYIALQIFLGLLAYAAIIIFHKYLSIGIIVAKLMSEGLLYPLNFIMQKEFVFKRERDIRSAVWFHEQQSFVHSKLMHNAKGAFGKHATRG